MGVSWEADEFSVKSIYSDRRKAVLSGYLTSLDARDARAMSPKTAENWINDSVISRL